MSKSYKPDLPESGWASDQRSNPTIMKINTAKAIAKSISAARTGANGATRRGKYTLVIRFWLATRELPDAVSERANNCHGTSAQNVETAYGTPAMVGFLLLPSSRPNSTLKTNMVVSGWITAHEMPSTDCL